MGMGGGMLVFVIVGVISCMLTVTSATEGTATFYNSYVRKYHVDL